MVVVEAEVEVEDVAEAGVEVEAEDLEAVGEDAVEVEVALPVHMIIMNIMVRITMIIIIFKKNMEEVREYII